MAVRADGRGRALGGWGLVLAAVLLAGCGAPEYTYVTNSADHTYLKVPRSWQPVDQASLEHAFGLDPAFSASDQGVWLAGYDAASAPSITHVVGVEDSDAPAVLVEVKDVPVAGRGQLSLDNLRDMYFPVSAASRQAAAANPSSGLSGFQLFVDEVLTPGKGLRGVHVVYRYSFSGGPPQMFDLTAYVNDDSSKVYVSTVHCSTQCYLQQQAQISTVVASFTVREKP